MIQSLQRAMELLEAMGFPDRSYSIAELSETLNLPPSTVHRILKTFCELNYVTKDEFSHLYKLGPALIPLGKAATHNVHLRDASKPILRELSSKSHEDAFLVILAGYKGYVVEKAEGPNNLKVVETFGYEVDLHWGAMRKVLLAYQSDEFICEYMEHGLSASPSHSAFDKEALLAELKEIRTKGFAVSKGDYIKNGFGIGAPVFDSNGRIVASIGIIAPTSSIKKATVPVLQELVVHAGRSLSQNLGYSQHLHL
ncbi:IclR family transcriptional regulator [Filifactor villosus]|uniref:IclR family transcriptional regulator n=1 Tax=Filifactor villosus TaxID=29374 RepID=A0ABV9QN34_9FIRM